MANGKNTAYGILNNTRKFKENKSYVKEDFLGATTIGNQFKKYQNTFLANLDASVKRNLTKLTDEEKKKVGTDIVKLSFKELDNGDLNILFTCGGMETAPEFNVVICTEDGTLVLKCNFDGAVYATSELQSLFSSYNSMSVPVGDFGMFIEKFNQFVSDFVFMYITYLKNVSVEGEVSDVVLMYKTEMIKNMMDYMAEELKREIFSNPVNEKNVTIDLDFNRYLICVTAYSPDKIKFLILDYVFSPEKEKFVQSNVISSGKSGTGSIKELSSDNLLKFIVALKDDLGTIFEGVTVSETEIVEAKTIKESNILYNYKGFEGEEIEIEINGIEYEYEIKPGVEKTSEEIDKEIKAILTSNPADMIAYIENNLVMTESDATEAVMEKTETESVESPEGEPHTEAGKALSSMFSDRMDQVVRGYLTAALWSSTNYEADDTPFDDDYDVNDFDKSSIKKAKQIIQDFLDKADNNALTDYYQSFDADYLGHDIWLTSHGHGAGFWDRDEISKESGESLTDTSDDIEAPEVYASDDGTSVMLEKRELKTESKKREIKREDVLKFEEGLNIEGKDEDEMEEGSCGGNPVGSQGGPRNGTGPGKTEDATTPANINAFVPSKLGTVEPVKEMANIADGDFEIMYLSEDTDEVDYMMEMYGEDYDNMIEVISGLYESKNQTNVFTSNFEEDLELNGETVFDVYESEGKKLIFNKESKKMIVIREAKQFKESKKIQKEYKEYDWDYIAELVESYVNGNISWVKSEVSGDWSLLNAMIDYMESIDMDASEIRRFRSRMESKHTEGKSRKEGIYADDRTVGNFTDFMIDYIANNDLLDYSKEIQLVKKITRVPIDKIADSLKPFQKYSAVMGNYSISNDDANKVYDKLGIDLEPYNNIVSKLYYGESKKSRKEGMRNRPDSDDQEDWTDRTIKNMYYVTKFGKPNMRKSNAHTGRNMRESVTIADVKKFMEAEGYHVDSSDIRFVTQRVFGHLETNNQLTYKSEATDKKGSTIKIGVVNEDKFVAVTHIESTDPDDKNRRVKSKKESKKPVTERRIKEDDLDDAIYDWLENGNAFSYTPVNHMMRDTFNSLLQEQFPDFPLHTLQYYADRALEMYYEEHPEMYDESKKTVKKEGSRIPERNFGFSFSTSDEYMIEANAEERGIEVDWDKINKDIQIIERNLLKTMKKDWGVTVRDEGHGSNDDLVGILWTDNPLVEKEILDQIEDDEPLSTGKGDFPFYEMDIFKGTSDQSEVIDVSISFFE